MNEFVLIADDSSGLHKALRERFGVADYVKTRITFPDGSDHETDLDWELIDPTEYYTSMKEQKAVYKTGVVAPELVEAVMEPYVRDGKDVLAITLSSRMSAKFNMFCVAAKHLEEQYPGRKVRIVDSLRFSTPIAMMYMKANELRAEGKTIDEVADWLEANRNRFHQMGPMDDLMFLARTGRVSGFKAFFGGMMGINSLGDYDPTGIAQVMGTVKGKKKALRATIDYVKKTIVDPENQTVFIGHTFRAEDAEELRRLVSEEINPKEIIVTQVDMSCGANVGPGMSAVYYMGEIASEDLANEKAVMNEILMSLK